MEILTLHEAFAALCKARGKWGVIVHVDEYTADDVQVWALKTAIPFLNPDQHKRILVDDVGIFLCDTEAEMDRIYAPMERDGAECWMYALTCDPNGRFLTENT